jgi:PPOX class probable F420-dependent enzyme
VQSIRRTSSSATLSPPVIEFLKRPLATQLATVNPSGSPQQTIIWFKYEDGEFLFTTTTDRVKFRNYQHNPRASLTILDPENMRKWVIVTGTLSVDNRDPLAFYQSLAEHYLDEKRLAEWRRTAMLERRTVLRLTPQRIRTLGFPAV